MWSESERRKKIWGVFDYFTVILEPWNIETFQQRNHAFCLWGGVIGGGGVLDPNHRPSSPTPNCKVCNIYLRPIAQPH